MALLSYIKTLWQNGQAPARNETNLNKQEQGIYDVTAETIAQAQQILDLNSPSPYCNIRKGFTSPNLVADTYAFVANYASVNNVGIAYNLIDGTITIPKDGAYRISINVVANFTTIANTTETLYVGVFDGIDPISDKLFELNEFLAKDASSGSSYPSLIFTATAGQEIRLGIKSSYALQDITFPAMSLEIESI